MKYIKNSGKQYTFSKNVQQFSVVFYLVSFSHLCDIFIILFDTFICFFLKYPFFLNVVYCYLHIVLEGGL